MKLSFRTNNLRLRKTALAAAISCPLLLTACWNQEKTEEIVPVIKSDGVVEEAPVQRTTKDTDPDTGIYFVRPVKMLDHQFGRKWKSHGQENPEEISKMLRMPSGILYRDIEVGYGLPPHLDARVLVHYIAYRPDGSIFDSSVDRGMPLVFTLGDREVMAGLQGGLINMQVGGVRKVIVPGRLCIGKLGKKMVPKYPRMTMLLRLLSVDQNYESSPPREEFEDMPPMEYHRKMYEKEGIIMPKFD